MHHQVLSFVYELSEDGTDVPKHAAVVKDRTFRYVCVLRIDSFFIDERPAKRTEWLTSKQAANEWSICVYVFCLSEMKLWDQR